MIIQALAPSRISLFGGSTDIPEYYKENGASIISFAINLRSTVTLYTDNNKWDKLGHSFPYGANPQLFYQILTNYKLNGMHHTRVVSTFDAVVGAGLGSSASASTALIACLQKYLQLPIQKEAIATEAYNTEVAQLQWFGGKQDQIAIVNGGFNQITFNPLEEKKGTKQKKDYMVTPILNGKDIIQSLVLFYVGGTRASKSIQQHMRIMTEQRRKQLDMIKAIATEAKEAIAKNDIQQVGRLLHESWKYKKKSNSHVSNDKIDSIYKHARDNGALAGKLLGAGYGGYMLFLTQDKKHFINKMKEYNLEDTDFSIDNNGLETRIL